MNFLIVLSTQDVGVGFLRTLSYHIINYCKRYFSVNVSVFFFDEGVDFLRAQIYHIINFSVSVFAFKDIKKNFEFIYRFRYKSRIISFHGRRFSFGFFTSFRFPLRLAA